MKATRCISLICVICFAGWSTLSAQNSGVNIGFEFGNFINWTGYTWRHKTDVVPEINTFPAAGIVSRRQTIISDTSAYDFYTGYALKEVPSGALFSAKLGDEIFASEMTQPRNWNQSLRYTLKVDSSNALLIFKFALVLEYAADHNELNEPRFKLTIYDSLGNDLHDCSNYDIFASNKNIKGFQTYLPDSIPGLRKIPIIWRDWTSVGANLQQYIGHVITLEFMTADCTLGHHFGYAYFVAECHPMNLITKYCASDTIAILKAPLGFERYIWKNAGGVIIDTIQNHVVTVPDEKQSYSCELTSATGCLVTLKTSIQRYLPKAAFSSYMLDCFTNTVQLTNQSTTNHGRLKYDWYLGSGKFSQDSLQYTFGASGLHKVTLIAKNPPSECADTLTKIIESFSPPLVGIGGDSTYCPGLGTFIKGYGAAIYDWSNKSHADSIEIFKPGGTYWLVGHSTTGCLSDTNYIRVSEEPDWAFTQNSDTIICGNAKVTLLASGAATYLWDQGETNDSIIVSTAGFYSVTGANRRGCKKALSFKVSAYELPETSFAFSPDALDKKHNILTLKSPAVDLVRYDWKTGDDRIESGSVVNHPYNIIDSVLYYKIVLISTSQHGCIDSSFKYIDVIPYIPNVFTPNGDGINDIFMHGFTLQIVDRNGMQVYSGTEGWDGRYKGRPSDPDTYFYNLIYNDSKERVHTRRGYIVLMR